MSIPHYSTCFVCGLNNERGLKLQFHYDYPTKEISTKFVLRKWLEGYRGLIHGGIVASILDDGMGWAVYPETGDYYLTLELDVKYKKPVRPNTEYIFKGRITNLRLGYFFTKGEILDREGDICVTAIGKYKRIPSPPENNTQSQTK